MGIQDIKGKLLKFRQIIHKAGEPTPEQINDAARYHGEHGRYPAWTSGRVKMLCDQMLEAAADLRESVGLTRDRQIREEENNDSV